MCSDLMLTWRNKPLLHEGAIAARLIRAEPDELVEVEGAHVEPIRVLCRGQPHELGIQPKRRSARRQPQHDAGQSPNGVHDGSPKRRGQRVLTGESLALHAGVGLAGEM